MTSLPPWLVLVLLVAYSASILALTVALAVAGVAP